MGVLEGKNARDKINYFKPMRSSNLLTGPLNMNCTCILKKSRTVLI